MFLLEGVQVYFSITTTYLRSTGSARLPPKIDKQIGVKFSQECFSHDILQLLETKTKSGEVAMDLEFFDAHLSQKMRHCGQYHNQFSSNDFLYFTTIRSQPSGMDMMYWSLHT
jgi:hypothetical protein